MCSVSGSSSIGRAAAIRPNPINATGSQGATNSANEISWGADKLPIRDQNPQ